MKVELTLSTPEINISSNAKICYATNSDKDITKSLVHGHSHLAALRFAYATFHIEGISVACQNQVVRSKHLDFMVQSKRYVSLDKGEFDFVMPEGLDTEAKRIMNAHWYKAIDEYRRLVDMGVKKEDARAILPANTSTKMNIAGNLQAYYDFFVLRLNNHAQNEIRTLAYEMYKLLQEEYPQVFTKELKEKLIKGK